MASRSRWHRYTAAAVAGTVTQRRQDEGRAASSHDPREGADTPTGKGGPAALVPRLLSGLRRGVVPAGWRTTGAAAGSGPDVRPSTELRLVPVAACAWAGAAAAVRVPGTLTLLAALASVALLVLCLLAAWRNPRPGVRRRASAVLAPLAVLVLIASSAGSAAVARTAGAAGEAVADGASITGEFTARGDARAAAVDRFSGKPRYLLEAEMNSFTRRGERSAARLPVLIIGDESYAGIHLGDTLVTAGKLSATEPGDRSAALLRASRAPAVNPSDGLQGLATDLRTGFAQRSTLLGATDAAGLLPGMVLGDRSTAAPDLSTAMQDTGLTHLTAVSGANCSYLLAFIFLVSRLVRLPRGWAATAAVAALACFVLVVRPDASVLRAAVMGSIGTVAVLTGRGKVPAALLCLCATVLLVVDPWLSGSYAFILSVCATAGLIFLGPRLTAALARFLPRPVAVLTAVPLAAQVACAPVLVLLQPNLPAYSLPANIAAAPVVPFVTIAGMAAVVLGHLAPPLDYPLLAAAGAGAGWVAGVARFFAQAPGALLPWLPGPAGAGLMAAAAAILTVCIVRTGQSSERTRADAGAPAGPLRKHGLLFRRWTTVFLSLVLASLAAVALAAGWRLIVPAPGPPKDWLAAACDVGQGDALAVRTGPRSAILIDAGPDPSALDECLDRLDIDTLDLLVISHLHTDHYAGGPAAGDGREVRALAYSSAESGVPEEIAGLGRELAVKPERLGTGMNGIIGGVRWKVLWPQADAALPAPPGMSENDASAVLLISSGGLNFLFTGDLEEEAALKMLRASPELRTETVHVLKVAHHGARNSGPVLPDELRPLLALISVGKENTYGHPAPETLKSLELAGSQVARTDLLGSFFLHIDDGKLLVSGLGSGW